MAKLRLDGVEIEVPDGAPLVEVIKQQGTFISNLCYIDGIPPYAGCRTCAPGCSSLDASGGDLKAYDTLGAATVAGGQSLIASARRFVRDTPGCRGRTGERSRAIDRLYEVAQGRSSHD